MLVLLLCIVESGVEDISHAQLQKLYGGESFNEGRDLGHKEVSASEKTPRTVSIMNKFALSNKSSSSQTVVKSRYLFV